MEEAKQERTALRRAFTRVSNNLETLVASDIATKVMVTAHLNQLEEKGQRLLDLDQRCREGLLANYCTTEEFDAEFDSAEAYRDKMTTCRAMAENFLSQNGEDEDESGSTTGRSHRSGTHSSIQISDKHRYRLPKLEWKQFDGDVRGWLTFWSQFKKVHEDKAIDDEEKFQYLIQATVSGSRARELVDSFPPTGDNYPKVIVQLKNRFGREETLVEVYVRELLKLVLKNTLNPKEKVSLSSLYDKLESQLRALETLGVTTEKCAAMLYPLVESCLPEDVHRAWERNRVNAASQVHGQNPPPNQLSLLMDFLRGEVEGEERITLARSGFGLEQKKANISKQKKFESEDFATAAGLMVSDMKSKDKPKSRECVFCGKGHYSNDCFQAQKLSLIEKKELVAKKKGCFLCLQNHFAKNCKTNVRCPVCFKRHVVSMCPELPAHKEKCDKKEEPAKSENLLATTPEFVKDVAGCHQCMYNSVPNSICQPEEEVEESTENMLAKQSCAREVLLQTLVFRLQGKSGEKIIRAVIDSGSQKTYITKSAALELGYDVLEKVKIVHGLFGGIQSGVRIHNRHMVSAKSLDGRYQCSFAALDETVICGKLPKIKNGPWMAELNQMGIQLTDYEHKNCNIDLLIGADHAGKLLTGRKVILKCGLIAFELYLGWTIMGELPAECPDDSTTMTVTSLFVREASIQDLWKLDCIGITDPAESKSKEELQQAAIQHFTDTVKTTQGGRYEICLPWIEGHPSLASHKELAVKRLKSTTKKLIDQGLLSQYNDIFREWLSDGIIEEVPDDELNNFGHYIPHRAVLKLGSETTPIRPVFDASARGPSSPSLNDCLEKGPNLLELILSVIIRFRLRRIGVTSDIKKAFLQIIITKKDRDFLRFYWWVDCEAKQLKCFRHCRVVFGISSSPFLLAAVINYHLANAPQELRVTADKLSESIYVDNCVTSVDTFEDLDKFSREAKELMAYAKFDLRLWEHTSMKKISNVLGLLWDLSADNLSVNVKGVMMTEEDEGPITKRKILSVAHRVFDPIGFTCPVTVLPKILLQQSWELKIGWDCKLPKEIGEKFKAWSKQLPLLADLKIPRWLFESNVPREFWSLHVFSDASKAAYASCVFMRTESAEGISVQLVLAKTRVAPVKKITIPRLELLACVIGVRLAETVKKVLDFQDIPTFYWSDSTNALSWIKRTDQWGTFVWNRVQEIRSFSKCDEWRHVPGVLNPADLPSRGCSVRDLVASKWWEGPEWLRKSSTFWPNGEMTVCEEDVNSEKKKSIVSSLVNSKHGDGTERYCQYLSKYSKIVKMIGWIYRFRYNASIKKLRRGERKEGNLSIQELKRAELVLLRLVQLESFGDVQHNSLSSLQTFKDEDGLIRIKTKLFHLDDSEYFKSPIVLPSKHRLVSLMVEEKHLELSHAGVQVLMSVLREDYWILSSRRTIRRVIGSCKKCRRFEAKNMEANAPPLPKNRVRTASVFEIVGVDLAGPLYLKDKSKAWIVLYTCAVYRAVHLELVTSLSTEAFLQSFRRFVSRRGRPVTVYSDNGTNFVGSENSFRKLDWKTITATTSVNRIEWKFNAPTASWWGGFWERLIGMVKKLLRRVLGKSSLYYEELATILCDCESVINSRPLTYVAEDPSDLIPLSPSLFLRELRNDDVPEIDILDSTGLNKRLRYMQKMRGEVRSRFRKEYLGQLVLGKKSQGNGVNVGDVILIGSDNQKRIDWPLARVLEVYPGNDGVVRVARLQTKSGELVRPIQRLYPFEVAGEERNDLVVPARSPCTLGSNSVEDCRPNSSIVTRFGRAVQPPDRLKF